MNLLFLMDCDLSFRKGGELLIRINSFQSWQSESQNADAYIIHENGDHQDNNDDHEEIEEEPLELVTRRPEPGEFYTKMMIHVSMNGSHS